MLGRWMGEVEKLLEGGLVFEVGRDPMGVVWTSEFGRGPWWLVWGWRWVVGRKTMVSVC